MTVPSAREPLIIRSVKAHPLRVQLPKPQKTGQATYSSLELVVVEVETENGLVGIGEGLARSGSVAYATLIEQTLAPRIVGQNAHDRRKLWKSMRSTMTGRPGGQLVEAIAAVDIALWDLAGKHLGVPVHALLGGMGRETVGAYASSINWLDDDTAAQEVDAALALGFREIKVKLGQTVDAAMARARLIRKLAPDTLLGVDCNWAFDVDEAMQLGRALCDLGYDFFEEPIVPHDRMGYQRLAHHLPIRLAAGESDYVSSEAMISLSDRVLGMIQPDVTRSGGITETWRIAELAAAHNVRFAPHVGWSGGICVAASLHLAAAAESFRTFECMVFDNPLRTGLCLPLVGDSSQLRDGQLAVPHSPGLGVELNREALSAYTIA